MRDSATASRLRAIAGHADYLLIGALIVAKLAGVEVRIGRPETPHEMAAGAMEMPSPVRMVGPMHLIAADENACGRQPQAMPRADQRRERERRARMRLFGA